MKKTKSIIFSIVAMLMISFACHAQTSTPDTVKVTCMNCAKTTTVDVDQLSNDLTILLPKIFDLLGHVGVNVTPFAGIILTVLPLIMTLIKRRRDKRRIAQHVKELLKHPDIGLNLDTLPNYGSYDGRHRLRDFLHKLSGNA